ncbi:MAG: PAS domain-containing protein [bacterium]
MILNYLNITPNQNYLLDNINLNFIIVNCEKKIISCSNSAKTLFKLPDINSNDIFINQLIHTDFYNLFLDKWENNRFSKENTYHEFLTKDLDGSCFWSQFSPNLIFNELNQQTGVFFFNSKHQQTKRD